MKAAPAPGASARAAILLTLLAGGAAAATIGTSLQKDAHEPHAWRALSADEQRRFDLGYATFDTFWSPVGATPSRTDGLGPIYDAASCDACHNSRRRGRGPRDGGEAPAELVLQLGRRRADGSLERGTPEYGRVLATAAIPGYKPEGAVYIDYTERREKLADGDVVALRVPHYRIDAANGPPLPANTVLMPRLPPSVFAVGLLERVPAETLVATAQEQAHHGGPIAGRVSWIEDHGRRVVGRFGWQATEASVAAQTSAAFAREMGLTTSRDPAIDCGERDDACRHAPDGGRPEVDDELFDAVVFFESVGAVPVATVADAAAPGRQVFERAGCAACHLPELPVRLDDGHAATIAAYTDLLLHDLGAGLADRSLDGRPLVPSRWRTAPLWGLHAASVASPGSFHLLHDGRARSVEEAVLWHDGEAATSAKRFRDLPTGQREALVAWLRTL